MKLYIFPNLLGSGLDHREFFPSAVDKAVESLDGLIAESVSGGRRFLKHFQTKKKPHEMPIALLKEKVDFLLEPVKRGEQWGMVTDAGLPCLADPGSLLIRRANKLKIAVHVFPGPCSITMALMLSGIYAQKFNFYGYLDKEPKNRDQQLYEIEQTKITTIFIETPYRNLHTFESCLKKLNEKTLLTVAVDLTLPSQMVVTQSIKQWRQDKYKPEKKPTIFICSPG